MVILGPALLDTIITKKRGTIRLREHYLRSDISCGSDACIDCPHLSGVRLLPKVDQYVILDTNVVLHNIDLLERPEITHVIILSTVLQEVRHRHFGIYKRLREIMEDKERMFYSFANEHHKATYVTRRPGESMNDRNDRAIRIAAGWYADHLKGQVAIHLVTDDRGNKAKAEEQGLNVSLLREFISNTPAYSDLLDHLALTVDETDAEWNTGDGATPGGEGGASGGNSGTRGGKKAPTLFKEYLPETALEAGVKEGTLFCGVYHTNRYNFQEAYVRTSDEDEFLISGQADGNRAIDGDVVYVKELPTSQWKAPSRYIDNGEGKTSAVAGDAGATDLAAGAVRSGTVVGIKRRAWRPYCGSIGPPVGNDTYLFIPVDRRVPRIRIQTRQYKTLADMRIVVNIDEWPVSSRSPLGHYVRTVGKTGEKQTESDIILLENGVNARPFTEKVLECLPTFPWSVKLSDLASRMDLRHLRICSIDPPGCTDIDDALHCRELPNGNIEVGVHIADVAHFIKPGTAIDEEAAARSTSVYLVERRIDMVPPALGENVCSLNENIERFAFSVIWELDSDYNTIKTTFGRSVIKSCAALAYKVAQARMDDASDTSPLTEDIRRLNRIARTFRKRRMDAGALTLASPAVKFNIDNETQDPDGIESYNMVEANHLVEEFMLFANVTVAKKILQHYPQLSVLRRHPPPSEKQLEGLKEILGKQGFTIDSTSSLSLANSLDKCRKEDDEYFNTMVRIMTTRCMQQARYFCSGNEDKDLYHHYGLAAPLYTHFTSPIRRYADVLVHRLLASCIGIEPLAPSLHDKDHVSKLCDVINQRHRLAQQCGRDSVALHTYLFFKNRVCVEEAVVMKVKQNGVVLLVPRYGVEGLAYLTPAQSAVFKFDSSQAQLVSGTTSIAVFSHVRVQISVEPIPGQLGKLKFELLTSGSNSSSSSSGASGPSGGKVGDNSKSTVTKAKAAAAKRKPSTESETVPAAKKPRTSARKGRKKQ